MNIRRHIVEFVLEQKTRWNALPNRSVICQKFGGLCDDVNLHLEQLEREGLLIIEPNGGERVDIPPTFRPVPHLALRGNYTNGEKPCDGIGVDGWLALDLRGIGIPMAPHLFALRVVDDCMLDAGLQRGDIAILRHVSPVRGDVVAVDLDGQTVLRRYLVIAGIPHVLAENPLRPDLRPCWELPLQGVLWGSIRTEPPRFLPDCVHRGRATYSISPRTTQPRSRWKRIVEKDASANDDAKRTRSRQAKPSGKRGSKVAIKTKGKSPYSRPNSDWPHPPIGIELNDMASLEYRSSDPSLVDDKPEYGKYLRLALKNYEEREKTLARRGQINDVSV